MKPVIDCNSKPVVLLGDTQVPTEAWVETPTGMYRGYVYWSGTSIIKVYATYAVASGARYDGNGFSPFQTHRGDKLIAVINGNYEIYS